MARRKRRAFTPEFKADVRASLRDGYEPPAGFKARLEHIEKLREWLSSESYDIDYFYSKESKLVLRLGGVTIPLGELPPADVDALCGEVERLEELVKLARRLLTLVE